MIFPRSLINLSSIGQLKGLELIPGLAFAFGSCCCEPTMKQTILTLEKEEILQRDGRNVRSGQINSFVHSEKKRAHWRAWELKKAWTSMDDNSGG